MAGAGAFPSPIAHLVDVFRVGCCTSVRRPKPKCVVGNFNAYGSECPGAVDVCWPLGYAGERCDGAFLVDSFHYLKAKSGNKTKYFPELLRLLWDTTGFVCCAVCAGGGALVRPGCGAATYMEMLGAVPPSAMFVIPIICGNDYYCVARPLGAGVLAAARDLCKAARTRGFQLYAVVGASSAVWGYDRKLSAAYASWFDANSESLCAVFMECGVPCTRGVFGRSERKETLV